MRTITGKWVLRSLTCIGALAAVVAGYHAAGIANPTTAALTFLLAVLVISAFWGLKYAVFTAVLATLAFNFFFLPPIGNLTIADPQNWIALFAFLVTAMIASELSHRARREAIHANRRRTEIECLYALSQRLLIAESVPELLNALPGHLAHTFGSTDAAIFLLQGERLYRVSAEDRSLAVDQLKAAAARVDPMLDSGVSLAPLRLGMRPIGSFGISGDRLSRETLEAIGMLIAIAIEHTVATDKLSKADAMRENEKLRSAILDSVSHQFRTPLTAIKASATTLLSDANIGPDERRDLLAVIDEESDRLNRLVSEAAEMARLEANEVELRIQMHSLREVVDRAIEQSHQALTRHPLSVSLASDLPSLHMDPERIQTVLVQLLENAGKYSPPESPIRITAERRQDYAVISIGDRGPGIDSFEQAFIFDKFYRGKDHRLEVHGTGMGLAIARAIVEAHSGSISITSQLGQGTVFSFSLPISR